MSRILFLLLVTPLLSTGPAHAQTGGIQVAPVMVAMSSDRGISSLRIRNGRDRAVAFEIDAYAWRQDNGRDVLTATRALIIAPGVFEIPAGGEQVVRLGVQAPDNDTEQSYRIIMRELPPARDDGVHLGFTLEMSLPVFVVPVGAHARMDTAIVGDTLQLTNIGRAHMQISSIEDLDGGALEGPRYLLAGASAAITLPPRARTIRLRATDVAGVQMERIVDVTRQGHLAAVR